jgi:DNA invertase Pin-like site-specific DNA recombinase
LQVHPELSLGGQVYDPADPMGKMFFNILATFAEFSVIWTRRAAGLPTVGAAV